MARKQPSKTRTRHSSAGMKVCPYDCPFEDRMLKHEDLLQWSSRLESGMDKFSQATQSLAVNFAGTTERTTQRIDAMEKKIVENQEAQKEDVKDLTSRLDQQTKALTDHFDKGIGKISQEIAAEKTDRKKQVEEVAARTTKLEKWQTYIIGGGAVVAFVIGSILIRFLWVFIEKFGAQIWSML